MVSLYHILDVSLIVRWNANLLARLHLINVPQLSILDDWIYIWGIHGTLNVYPNVTSFYVNFLRL
jgi:hypothetical protein